MKKELALLSNKCKFVTKVNNGSIVLRDRSKQQIVDQLKSLCFDENLSSRAKGPGAKGGDEQDEEPVA